jgi:dihydropteroate synthase
MGIVNCTPDSFYDGGRCAGAQAAVARYHQVIDEGADMVDVGGESTRPGASPVTAEEEWERVGPVVAAARQTGHPVPLSIDTTKHDVARRALDAGAAIVNDVSGLRSDPRLADLAARYGAGLILMHMRGTPRTMQDNPRYGDVVGEIREELGTSVGIASAHGVAADQIIVDPGVGFGKTAQHNLEIINRLGELTSMGCPVLIGCSRKSFIGAVLDLPPEQRLEGTLAAHTAAALHGAHMVRAHDVRAHRRAMGIADALLAAAARAE